MIVKLRALCSLVLIVSCFSKSYAQDNFKEGTIWFDDNRKEDVQILDEDWRYNPEHFLYRSAKEESSQRGDLKSISSFQIGAEVKYLKAVVDIDQSPDQTGSLSTFRAPDFVSKEVFLKVIVASGMSLLSYNSPKYKRFYILDKSGEFHPLIFKRYSPFSRQIGTNEEYKNQLKTLFPGLEDRDYENLAYSEKDLSRFLLDYQNARQIEALHFQAIRSKPQFDIQLKFTANGHNTSVANDNNALSLDEPDNFKSSFAFGLSLGWQLPFDNNRWLLFIEPSYLKYNQIVEENQAFGFNGSVLYRHELRYESINCPLLIRRSFYLNQRHSLFINGGLLMDFPIKTEFQRDDFWQPLDLGWNFSPIIGLGYQYQNWSAEFRFNHFRDLAAKYVEWTIDQSTLGLILAYDIY